MKAGRATLLFLVFLMLLNTSKSQVTRVEGIDFFVDENGTCRFNATLSSLKPEFFYPKPMVDLGFIGATNYYEVNITLNRVGDKLVGDYSLITTVITGNRELWVKAQERALSKTLCLEIVNLHYLPPSAEITNLNYEANEKMGYIKITAKIIVPSKIGEVEIDSFTCRFFAMGSPPRDIKYVYVINGVAHGVNKKVGGAYLLNLEPLLTFLPEGVIGRIRVYLPSFSVKVLEANPPNYMLIAGKVVEWGYAEVEGKNYYLKWKKEKTSVPLPVIIAIVLVCISIAIWITCFIMKKVRRRKKKKKTKKS